MNASKTKFLNPSPPTSSSLRSGSPRPNPGFKNLFSARLDGFTILELLIYVSVLAIFVGAAVSILLWVVKINNKTSAQRELIDNAQRIMEEIGYEFREAKGVYTPTTNSTQLSLETAKYLPPGENSSYIDFYLCGSQLCFKQDGQRETLLTSAGTQVNYLNFQTLATTTLSLQIGLGLSFKASYINATSTFSMRSY